MRKTKAVLIAVLIVVAQACATAPGADSLVVRAEQLQQIGFDMVKAFLHLERTETKTPGTAAFLNKPDIHAFAEKLRGSECGIPPDLTGQARLDRLAACPGTAYHGFTRLKNAVRTYKTNRNEANKAELNTWFQTAMSLVTTVQQYMGGTTAMLFEDGPAPTWAELVAEETAAVGGTE